MHRYLLPLLVAAAISMTGCYTNGTYAASVGVASPDLVHVGSGVYAVAGYGDSIYYADNYYWRYDNGYWYRSPYYTGGWRYHSRPPVAIRRIDRPYAYYYRDGGRVRVQYRDRYRYDRPYRYDRSYRYDRPYRYDRRYRSERSYRHDQPRVIRRDR